MYNVKPHYTHLHDNNYNSVQSNSLKAVSDSRWVGFEPTTHCVLGRCHVYTLYIYMCGYTTCIYHGTWYIQAVLVEFPYSRAKVLPHLGQTIVALAVLPQLHEVS